MSLINTFNVSQIHIVGVPIVQNVYNQFDEFGLFIGLPRLSGENIESYKARLLDTYINRANSTYQGLINGITRELGLKLYNPIRIYPIKSNGVFVAENPIITFSGPYVQLWRDKINNILEMEIDRFNPDGDAYQIRDLVSFINSRSIYFGATLINNDWERSMTICNQSNYKTVGIELVPASENFQLNYPNINGGSIIPSSLFFSDNNVFANLVPNQLSVINDGDYFIDYYTGNVFCSLTPTAGTTVRYTWIDYGWKPVASPVIINNISSSNFQRKMFNQVLADDGTFYNGIPTEYGASLINELLSVFALYNGM